MEAKNTLSAIPLFFLFFGLVGCSNPLASPRGDSDLQAEKLLASMTLDEKIGQLLMPSFRLWKGVKVKKLNEEIARIIQNDHLGGVILFAENIESPEQTIALNEQLQGASKLPLFIAVDQEGGLVNRVPFMTTMPGAMALGAARSQDLSYRTARAVGAELLSLGFNLDFAPVLDVNVNPDNPVIGVRSFGANPKIVEDLGTAFFKGLQDAGVASTAKHFPGHGDTDVDSHLELPCVAHPRERLKNVELKPFQRAMREGIDLIMSAHVTFPAIDDSTVKSKKDGSLIHLPATLSRKVLTGLMREEMGFRGVIVTDAFSMKAISDHFGKEEAVLMAVKAGADVVLMPEDVDKAFKAIRRAVDGGEIPVERIEQSAKRIVSLKFRRGLFEKKNKTGFSEERAAHQALAREASDRCVTVLRSDKLPWSLYPGLKVLVLAPNPAILEEMKASLQPFVEEQGIVVSGRSLEGMTVLNAETILALASADCVVLGTYSSGKLEKKMSVESEAIASAAKSSRPLAVLALRNPYDVLLLPEARSYLAVYGRANVFAGMRVIFGLKEPEGLLPVSIPGLAGNPPLFEEGFGLRFDFRPVP